ncbi:MAG TPA: peptidoglycan-binding protein [Bryobacteraceae bacterium]|nr:peptidoglycan-binding protein [Bryobacteraceae bacterium]
MRKVVSLAGVLALGLLGFAADGAAPAQKRSTSGKSAATVHKKGVSTTAAARTTARQTTSSTRATASKRGKKGPVRRPAVTWRNRQLAPTAERYKQIQDALVAKGYLPADAANGKWSDSSTEALKKFQADQNLDGNGKINSLSLIALGLGPKRDTSPAKPPTPPPVTNP